MSEVAFWMTLVADTIAYLLLWIGLVIKTPNNSVTTLLQFVAVLVSVLTLLFLVIHDLLNAVTWRIVWYCLLLLTFLICLCFRCFDVELVEELDSVEYIV